MQDFMTQQMETLLLKKHELQARVSELERENVYLREQNVYLKLQSQDRGNLVEDSHQHNTPPAPSPLGLTSIQDKQDDKSTNKRTV